MPLTPYCPEIHIEQVGSTVDKECACRNAILGVVGTLGITIACTRQHEEHMLGSQLVLNGLDELSQFAVETEIGILKLHLTVCHSLVTKVAGIVGQAKQVCHSVVTQCLTDDTLLSQFGDI